MHARSRCARSNCSVHNDPLPRQPHTPLVTGAQAITHIEEPSQSPPDLTGCQAKAHEPLDSPELLSSLYGSSFDANVRGQGSVLLLGNHGTSTSMLTRLLMLMGLFQGNRRGARVVAALFPLFPRQSVWSFARSCKL